MQERIVFITGGGSGLGRNLVLKFLENNYKVFFTFRQEREAIDKFLSENPDRLGAIRADASDFHQVLTSVESAVGKFGRIDVLINNAASAKDSSLENSDVDDFDYTIKNVLYPAYYYSKVISTYMIANNSGTIINIGSVNGLHGREGSIAYSAAKAGVVGLSKTIAKELGKYNINCNVVVPGFINTDKQKKTNELVKKLVLSECYIKKLSEPDDICNLIMFLASKKAMNITGQVYQIDCGQYI